MRSEFETYRLSETLLLLIVEVFRLRAHQDVRRRFLSRISACRTPPNLYRRHGIKSR